MPINYGKPRSTKKLVKGSADDKKSPYRRMMDDKRKKERAKNKFRGAPGAARNARLASEPEDRTWQGKLAKRAKAKTVEPLYCGAKKKRGQPGKCRLPAGFGTNHYGQGRCKWHGGASSSYQRKLDKEAAVKNAELLGSPKEINPLDAIIWCIQIKAGEVEWLSMKIAELDEQDWVENSIAGRRLNLWARQRDDATKALVDFSQIAIRLGLAERAVMLAEQYGEMLAALIQGILGDLNLDVNQRAAAPAIIRRHLILVQGGIGKELPKGADQVIEGEAEETA